MKLSILAFCKIILFGSLLFAQDPWGLDQRQIDTEHFRVVFPAEIENSAQRVANTLEHLYAPTSKTLGVAPKKISIILRNQTTISNGFVTLMPRRSEFFMTPPQGSFLGSADWLETLAVHEFRHVAQIEATKIGTTKILSYIFGDLGQLLGRMPIPPWIWEGDAVGVETLLSNSGRGRLPEFDIGIRTILLNDWKFSYDKMSLGSFKHHIPNWYPFGYLMTTHLKRNYGVRSIGDIMSRTAKFPFFPYPFSFAAQRTTGKRIGKIYKDTMSELDRLWNARISGLKFTEATPINRRSNPTFTSYKTPKFINDASVVAVKSGLGDFVSFVELDEFGNEKVLFVPGYRSSETFSVEAGKIVWSEFEFDRRWDLRHYSVIKLYDFQSKKIKKLRKRSRLFSPSLSPDGTRIAAIEFDEKDRCSLLILSANDGSEVRRFPNPSNDFLSDAKWSDDGTKILFVRTRREKGKSIAFVDLQGVNRELISWTHDNLTSPTMQGNLLFFGSNYSGIDNIYVLNVKTDRQFQVTSRMFGAFDPDISIDRQKMIFSDYTEKGHNVVYMPINTKKWLPIEKVEIRKMNYFEPLIAEESSRSIFENVPKRKYKISRYRKFRNLLNIHSWQPIADEADNLGFALFSQNELGTLASSIGVEANSERETRSFFGEFTYRGLYPILSVKARYGGRTHITGEFGDKNEDRIIYSWNEKKLSMAIGLPLNFSRGKYYQGISVGISTGYSETSNSNYFLLQENGKFRSIGYGLTFQRFHRMARRDILPLWGQAISFRYHKASSLKERKFHGDRFFVRSKFIFPGIFRHNSLTLKFGAQKLSSYFFKNMLTYPRGHETTDAPELFVASIDYHFPIFYPDLNLFGILNSQRIRGALFYDYGTTKNGKIRSEKLYRSVGIELSSDTNLFRFPFLLKLGVRYAYLIDLEKSAVEFVVGDL